MLNVQYVLQLYAAARREAWPCPRDFLRELGCLMPKRRIWRQGKALTVYAVLESEVVPIAQRKRARVA